MLPKDLTGQSDCATITSTDRLAGEIETMTGIPWYVQAEIDSQLERAARLADRRAADDAEFLRQQLEFEDEFERVEKRDDGSII